MDAHVRHLISRLAAVSLLLTLVAAAPPAAAQSSGWTAGPGAVLENTYDGFIDVPSGGATVPGAGQFALTGWVVDRTAQGWAGIDDVQVFLGTMDGGGTMLARASFAQNRPDVATALGNPYFAASGFNAVINGASVPAGNQTLSVYAHTPGKGWWYKQVNVVGGGAGTGTAAPAPAPTAPTSGEPPDLTITSPTPEENVSTRSNFIIRGFVVDPGTGARTIDRVQVYINGERDSGQFIGDATVEPDGSWSREFEPTRYPSQHSNLYVYAHSSASGKETVETRGFNIVDR